jgi:hypothetical protein
MMMMMMMMGGLFLLSIASCKFLYHKVSGTMEFFSTNGEEMKRML